ncbi:MAG: hypothetical protein ABIW36_07985 [Terrimesophilobacter sp.]
MVSAAKVSPSLSTTCPSMQDTIGVQPHVDPAPAQVSEGPQRQFRTYLRGHPVGGFEQHPVEVPSLKVGVIAQSDFGQIAQLGDRFDAGVTAADGDEGEGLLSLRRVFWSTREWPSIPSIVAVFSSQSREVSRPWITWAWGSARLSCTVTFRGSISPPATSGTPPLQAPRRVETDIPAAEDEHARFGR